MIVKYKSDNIKLEDHIGLVCNLASPYALYEPVKDSEAYAEGIIALMRAIETYDPVAGEFSTWAYVLIKNHLVSWYRSDSLSKHRIPTENLTTQALENIPENRIDIFRAQPTLIEKILNDFPSTYKDQKHKEVLIKYFLDNRSLSDIAKEMDLTTSRVWQLRNAALLGIRERLTEQLAPEEDDYD